MSRGRAQPGRVGEVTPLPPRLGRAQRTAQTRRALLDAATALIARVGLPGASVEAIATEAGFTKGAFYGQFDCKETLLLTLLDERFVERERQMDALLGTDAGIVDQASAGGRELARSLRSDPDWERVFFELALFAAQDERFHTAFADRYRALRQRLASVIADRLARAGVTDPPIAPDDLAAIVFAAVNGVAFDDVLLPDPASERRLATLLELLALGAAARDAQSTSRE